MSGLPIEQLVAEQLRRLGISRGELVRRAGYQNEAKGANRLRALLAGELKGNEFLIEQLPAALGISEEAVGTAIGATHQQIIQNRRQRQEVAEAERIASFRPHAIILTERTIPQPVFVAAVIGVKTLLRVDLQGPNSGYVRQVLRTIEDRATLDGQIPAFGRPTGFVINFELKRAVAYDRSGHAVRVLPAARPLGRADLSAADGRLFQPGKPRYEATSATRTTSAGDGIGRKTRTRPRWPGRISRG